MSLGGAKALLTHEETMELIKKSQSGDSEAREILVESNLGLIRSVLKGFLNRNYDVEDLFQIGSIGLIKAIDKFDVSYDVKFSTYAVPMIIGEIKRFLRDDGAIKVSRSLKQTATLVRNAEEKLSRELGRQPNIHEISEEIGIEKEEITMALESTSQLEYLYDVVYEKDGSPIYLIDKISEEKDYIEDTVDNLILKEVLGQLKPRDRQIIILRYFNDKTQIEVAKLLGISQVQVSRIEKRIFEDIRKFLAKA